MVYSVENKTRSVTPTIERWGYTHAVQLPIDDISREVRDVYTTEFDIDSVALSKLLNSRSLRPSE